mgnify:CR=1 FL=1
MPSRADVEAVGEGVLVRGATLKRDELTLDVDQPDVHGAVPVSVAMHLPAGLGRARGHALVLVDVKTRPGWTHDVEHLRRALRLGQRGGVPRGGGGGGGGHGAPPLSATAARWPRAASEWGKTAEEHPDVRIKKRLVGRLS